MKKKEEAKPVETPPEVRLKAEEVKTEVTPPAAEVPAVKPAELVASIDNLAKIVDNSIPPAPVHTVPATPDRADDRRAYLWLAISFLLGLGLGIGVGYLIWGRAPSAVSIKTVPAVNVSPTLVPKVTVVPSPATVTATPGSLSKAVLKIEVLNGTGGKGVAAAAKELLTTAGYPNVTAGNAETEDYTQTEISIKNSKNAYLDGLKKDLAGKYTIAGKVTVLAESNKYDVIITIGLK